MTSAAACGRTPLVEPVDAAAPDAPPGDASRDAAGDAGPACRADFECDDGRACNGPERCFAGRCQPGAPPTCDDGLACTDDRCDEVLGGCAHVPQDRDLDGHLDLACGGRDCDDADPLVHPSAGEACMNGRDDDCNGATDCEDRTCAMDPACFCVPRPEVCDNGVDDDCDLLADCADPSCARSPACACIPSPESCSNGADDDCDLLVDCADPECRTDPVCCMPVPEVCTNGRDDDCDRRTDCADMDCAAHPACRPPCPDRDLGSRTGDGVAAGSTVGLPNDLTASCAGGARSPDIAFSWTAPSTGRWVIDTIGSDYDTALHVHDRTCGGAELACDDDSGPATRSRIGIDLTMGQVVVIVVDGFGTSAAGNYVLNVNRAVPEAGNCADGVDNDRDGMVDCMDSDCRTDAACVAPCPDLDLGTAIGAAVSTGTTAFRGDELTGTCAFNRSADVALSWTAPRTARYVFDTAGSSFNTLLYLLDGSCAGAQLACDDDGGGGTASRIVRTVTGGDRLVIVVDGSGTAAGPYVLNIAAREAPLCTDGIDNDADGQTDCADSECAGRPECCVPAPETCSNGVDDDCDALVDCADPNCNFSPACCMPRPENCANAMDEDCDGLIDCVDPDCRLDPRC